MEMRWSGDGAAIDCIPARFWIGSRIGREGVHIWTSSEDLLETYLVKSKAEGTKRLLEEGHSSEPLTSFTRTGWEIGTPSMKGSQTYPTDLSCSIAELASALIHCGFASAA